MPEYYSFIIIGAGLSGLYTAWRLQQLGQDVVVLEARDRIGGRILSSGSGNDTVAEVDLGPTWVWPSLQPELDRLCSELDIKLFNQYVDGNLLFESKTGQIERYSGQSAHEQSYRIDGGCDVLIKNLQSRLASSCIQLSTPVKSINQQNLTVEAETAGKAVRFSADKIILTVPPRLMAQSIEFIPPMENELIQAWQNIPTWMAAHCKVVFIYQKAFWREQGLSGEVFSHCGPLTEIYDASAGNETFYALTSFVGLTAQQREQVGAEKLKQLCLDQLQRLFGNESLNVIDIQIKDWSNEDFTTTEMDLKTVSSHPQYPNSSSRSISDNRIIFSGTETARMFGGYLEGALESAEESLKISSII